MQLHFKPTLTSRNSVLYISQDELYVLKASPEKYAREKYLMHKADEEVFVVVKD